MPCMRGPFAALIATVLLLRIVSCRTATSPYCCTVPTLQSKPPLNSNKKRLFVQGGGGGESEEGSGVGVDIDHQLYSRQLFVYGLTAQRKLMNSKVLIYGNGPLTAEVVKNLAMAGVRTMTIIGGDGVGTVARGIKGENKDLSEYATALNPNLNIKHINGIQTIDDLAADEEVIRQYDLFVSCDNSINDMVRINEICRKNRVKMVGCYTLSVTGIVFNDFLEDFTAESVAGNESDNAKTVPLLSYSIDSNSDSGVLGTSEQLAVVMTIRTIEEESVLTLLGPGDKVLITDTTPRSSSPPLTPEYTVLAIVDKNTFKIQIPTKELAAGIAAVIDSKNGCMRKAKKFEIYNHKSLSRILGSSTERSSSSSGGGAGVADYFSSYNGCLPRKKDRAISLCVLSLLQTFEEQPEGLLNISYDSFRKALIQRLVANGMVEPLESFKNGGVGADTLDRLGRRFHLSLCNSKGGFEGGSQCHATVSVVGAIASQEALKAVSGLYSPVNQLLLFESLDSVCDTYSGGDRAHHCIYGSEEVSEELRRMRVFMVGSGAIGCELLKTLAMMGACSHGGDESGGVEGGPWAGLQRGGVVVTDMDHIEKSNLNRQLLFRQRHVGQPKALVAADMVRRINQQFAINAITKKLHAESEDYFDSTFWSNVDVVLTALDNIDARRYVDELCVRHKKWLLDSGTLGTKGNTQVVIPFVSESYSSSADPPEDSIAMCTLKSFPYHPDHCIAWGKAAFEQVFLGNAKAVKAAAEFALSYGSGVEVEVEVRAFVESLAEDDARGLLELLPALLGPASIDASRGKRYAQTLFQRLFVSDIQQLMREHPPHSLDDEGGVFWGGSRRIPKSLVGFDTAVDSHVAFEDHMSYVFSRVFGEVGGDGLDDSIFSSGGDVTAADMLSRLCSHVREGDALCVSLLSRLASGVRPEEFEKDDQRDQLGHVDLVADFANLRSTIYGLPMVSSLEVQRVAGKIVPALATTTSLVAGLVCLELVKVACERVRLRTSSAAAEQQKVYSSSREKERLSTLFRNSYVNLAKPLFTYSQPVPAEAYVLANIQTSKEDSFSLWSVLEPSQSGREVETITIGDIRKEVKKVYGLKVTSVSYGDLLLYADFLPRAKESRAVPLLQLMERAIEEGDAALDIAGFTDDRSSGSGSSSSSGSSVAAAHTQGFVDLQLCCEDDEGVDARLPPYRVRFRDVNRQ